MGSACWLSSGRSRIYEMARDSRRPSSSGRPKRPAGHGSTATWSKSVMPRARIAACQRGSALTASPASQLSSSRIVGQTPSTFCTDTTWRVVSETSASSAASSGPATSRNRTRRSTASRPPASKAATTSLWGSSRWTSAKRGSSGTRSSARSSATASRISSAPSGSRGWGNLARLPGVGLGRGAARTGKDLVEPLERVVVEGDLERAQTAVELLERARPDDRRGDGRLREQPGDGDVGGLLAEVGAQLLPGLELVVQPVGRHLHAVGGAPALSGLADGAAEQAAAERAPRQDADAVGLARRDHLELDQARVEVVEALLRHESERSPPPRRLVGGDDVPAGEVGAADVD